MKLLKLASKYEGQKYANGAYVVIGRNMDGANTKNGFYFLLTSPITRVKTITDFDTDKITTEPCNYRLALSFRKIRNAGKLRRSFHSTWTPTRLLGG